jgi:hypothetical protein
VKFLPTDIRGAYLIEWEPFDEIGWVPEYDLDSAIDKTTGWWRDHAVRNVS